MTKKVLSIISVFIVLTAMSAVALADIPPFPVPPANIALQAVPTTVNADGIAVSTITATLTYSNGQPSSGADVFFNTDFGSLSTQFGWYSQGWLAITDGQGNATATISSVLTGTATITATSGSITSSPVTATFSNAPPDTTPPVVTNPTASPATILNDNGRVRAPGTNKTTINVTVTDEVAVSTVTIDLSPIGGSANASMANIVGTNNYTITTNATAGINLTNTLVINASDTAGNSNTSVNVSLTVLRRGDIVRNNLVTGADALFIEQYVVGLRTPTAQQLFVGDVVPANISNGVSGGDALYIEQLQVGLQTQQP